MYAKNPKQKPARGDNRTVDEALTQARNAPYKHRILTGAEERILARRIERGDPDAKEEMINCNMRLVNSIARRYMGACRNLDLDDLVADGVLGLVRATEKFDYRKGYKFSTYATWWIQQSIQREIANTDSTIRLPAHIEDTRRAVDRFRRQFESEHHRAPTYDEITENVDVSPELLTTMDNARTITWLDKPVGDEADTTFADFIASQEPETEELAVSAATSTEVLRAVAQLPKLERRVLTMRYQEHLTLKEIANRLEIEAHEARAIEHHATKSLHDAMTRDEDKRNRQAEISSESEGDA